MKGGRARARASLCVCVVALSQLPRSWWWRGASDAAATTDGVERLLRPSARRQRFVVVVYNNYFVVSGMPWMTRLLSRRFPKVQLSRCVSRTCCIYIHIVYGYSGTTTLPGELEEWTRGWDSRRATTPATAVSSNQPRVWVYVCVMTMMGSLTTGLGAVSNRQIYEVDRDTLGRLRLGLRLLVHGRMVTRGRRWTMLMCWHSAEVKG